jgi:hypothetical protein
VTCSCGCVRVLIAGEDIEMENMYTQTRLESCNYVYDSNKVGIMQICICKIR